MIIKLTAVGRSRAERLMVKSSYDYFKRAVSGSWFIWQLSTIFIPAPGDAASSSGFKAITHIHAQKEKVAHMCTSLKNKVIH